MNIYIRNSDCNAKGPKVHGPFSYVNFVDVPKDKVINMKEIWKSVEGFEGLYEVSNLGRVRSLDREVRNRGGIAVKRGKILSPKNVNTNYKAVNLWKKNKGYMRLVHRLVAIAFLPNPENLPQVNHKDEDPSNNNVNNLEWCDSAYNANYGTAIARRSAKTKGVPRPQNGKPIAQYTKDGRLVKIYLTAMEAARALTADNSSICHCANGAYKSSYGYVWRWVDVETGVTP